MKRLSRIISIIVVLTLILVTPMLSMAAKGNDKAKGKGNNKDKGKPEIVTTLDSEIEDVEESKAWKENKAKLEAEKDTVEEQKNQIEAEKDELEAQYEAAKESGDLELASELKTQINGKKAEMNALKGEMKNIKQQMKQAEKEKYTEEELEQISSLAEEIVEDDSEAQVLSVDSIITKGNGKKLGWLKFDAPPVIKQGRTLIPVKAITEGMGADVDLNEEEQKATITLDGIEIVFQLDSNIVLVNGEEVEIDAASTMYSNRTYVPLRFIAETFGLALDYDEESDTIEIGDEENTENVDDEVEEDIEDEGVIDSEEDSDTEDDIDSDEEATDEEDLVESELDNVTEDEVQEEESEIVE